MRNLISGMFVLLGTLVSANLTAQIPATQKDIDLFLDSLRQSSDRLYITSKILPANTDGNNWKWFLEMVYNKNNDLLWAQEIEPDSASTSYIFCKDQLIFVSHFNYTYILDSVSNKQKPFYRNVYFDQEKILSDSSPGSLVYTYKYFLDTSRKHLAHFKLKDK